MTVQRFRSIVEMNATPVRASSEAGVERFFRHCARYWAVAPRSYPRGVFRFRSIDEAQDARRSVRHAQRPTAGEANT